MSSTFAVIFAAFSAGIAHGQSRAEYYGNWMNVMSSNPSSFGSVTFNDQTLMEVTLPGSHHAGMYASAIIDNGYTASDDDFYTDVLSQASYNDDRKVNWCSRQVGTVYDQLMAGSRFLDIRLEESGSLYYAHHGVLGATLNDVCEPTRVTLSFQLSL